MKTVFRGIALVLMLTTLTACPNNRDNTPGQNTDAEQGSGIAQPEPEPNQDQNPD